MAVARRAISDYGMRMTLLADNSTILTKTRELCAAIAEDPTFLQLQERIERFLDDDASRTEYQGVHDLGEQLHHKQHAGIEIGAAESKAFEAARDALFENPVACDFMSAQRELEMLRKEIGQYIGMTLELGRVPTAEELADAAGGGGCCGGGGGGGGCCCD
jgi:cell fate (sporulation/competence/biofilm development) regulator YlbF (YheA/YmcA/DUF963 family)